MKGTFSAYSNILDVISQPSGLLANLRFFDTSFPKEAHAEKMLKIRKREKFPTRFL